MQLKLSCENKLKHDHASVGFKPLTSRKPENWIVAPPWEGTMKDRGAIRKSVMSIPQARIGYEMVDSQQGTQRRVG